ncbi:fumarylacetoacetate hydrolase family protein [Mycolicibacterium mageritense]|uniref:fumarylacetoacetate hydrolase family protein n=1 Tax=Mycolicibacterium mageritense TaxID=53462 RepID=UPI001E43039F|nr:fumarylacetoacetate hydrolase family protein [Mycolicibacterium mageritense]GJJ21232.1 fumarylacetoacetate hydrolase [Mycolicibacterium mageritense]
MRLLNIDNRLHVETAGGYVADVEKVSSGVFAADPQAIYDRWDEFVDWCASSAETLAAEARPRDGHAMIGPPAPRPPQVFAVGLNYDQHAAESGFAKPQQPVIFTKFVSSITGPVSDVTLPDGDVDWEVELVVVMGRGGRNISAANAWRHVAGLTVGQDISERRRQHAGPAPQFSLAKSHEGFSPIGPVVVTPDEFADPDDVELGATINGQQVQHGRTSDLIFPVPVLIEEISRIVALYPGDVIFTGTPQGIGAGRVPPRFLKPGEVLRSYVSGIGELVQTFTADNASLRDGAGAAAARS